MLVRRVRRMASMLPVDGRRQPLRAHTLRSGMRDMLPSSSRPRSRLLSRQDQGINSRFNWTRYAVTTFSTPLTSSLRHCAIPRCQPPYLQRTCVSSCRLQTLTQPPSSRVACRPCPCSPAMKSGKPYPRLEPIQAMKTCQAAASVSHSKDGRVSPQPTMETQNRVDKPPSNPPTGRGHSGVYAEQVRPDDDRYAASVEGAPTDLDHSVAAIDAAAVLLWRAVVRDDCDGLGFRVSRIQG